VNEGNFSFELVAAAHELKAPLSLMRQLALLLEDDSLTLRERQLYAERLRLTSERGLRLTSDLTSAHRAASSLFPLEPINPLYFCKDIADEYRPLCMARGAQIRVARVRTAPAIIANRDLLRRVLVNFIDNALKYNESIKILQLHIGQSKKSVVRIGVREYGGEKMPKRQSNLLPAADSTAASSGLGLFLAGEFARNMQAKIGSRAHRQGGSTYYIDVPISKQLMLL